MQERPLLVLCDGAGAGSAACAEVGARALSEGMRRVLISLAPCLGKWLDEEIGHDELAQLAMLLVRHAKGINADLAVAGLSGRGCRAALWQCGAAVCTDAGPVGGAQGGRTGTVRMSEPGRVVAAHNRR
ncbi:hypothetical protein ACEUB9_07610 [Aeromonas veronii]